MRHVAVVVSTLPHTKVSTMSAQNKSLLLRLLSVPGIENIPVMNISSGELTLEANGGGPQDRIQFIIDPGAVRNLLEFAPREWWQDSESLFGAVDTGLLSVLDPNSQQAVNGAALASEPEYIISPADAMTGDMLVYNGDTWISLPAGPIGYVITSGGPGIEPTYQPVGGGALDPSILVSDGQTTGAMLTGRVGYLTGNNTWAHASSDGTLAQATAAGFFLGTPGSMITSGRILAANFTLAGGAPAAGQEVYLAATADDGGSGAGKLTATAPVSGFLTPVGVCMDNTNYGASQTCVVSFNPGSPQSLA